MTRAAATRVKNAPLLPWDEAPALVPVVVVCAGAVVVGDADGTVEPEPVGVDVSEAELSWELSVCLLAEGRGRAEKVVAGGARVGTLEATAAAPTVPAGTGRGPV